MQRTSRGLGPLAILVGVVAVAAVAGCGSGSSGDDFVVRDGEAFRPGRALVLTDVPAGTSEAQLVSLYDRTLAEPACQDPTDQRVPVLVAQACLAFHDLYLEPSRLPADVRGIETPDAYVAAIEPADPFAVYHTADAFSGSVEPGITGERAFIGFRFRLIDGDWTISRPPPPDDDLPAVLPYTRAWWDGLREGDRLVAVEDPESGEVTRVDGLTEDQARALLPRTEDERVILIVERDGEELRIPTAAETHIEKLLDGDVAYLGVRSFTTQTADRVREDYNSLKTALGNAPSGVVLDLRDDSGGSFRGAIELADFLAGGSLNGEEMFHTEDSWGLAVFYRFGDWFLNEDTREPIDIDPVPLVILVDAGSASASEIVAGVLQYRGVAKLVGETTFGKGVAQTVEQLLDGSALLIPSQRIELPDGTSWHGAGLTPDVAVAAPEGGATPEDDPQLQAALAALRGEPPTAAARRTERRVAPRELWEHRIVRPDLF